MSTFAFTTILIGSLKANGKSDPSEIVRAGLFVNIQLTSPQSFISDTSDFPFAYNEQIKMVVKAKVLAVVSP